MAIHKFFIFLFFSLVHGQDYCPASYCDKNGLYIKFPFWLQGQQLTQNCQPYGFNIRCGGQKKAILNIPYSGDFNATSIDYHSKRVSLSDPGNCLPRRLLNLNLSSSPFMAIYYQSYTFLSCPKGLASSRYVVDCLSNTTTDIAAANYETDLWLFTKCKIIVTLPLPVSSSYISRFPVDLELTWKVSPTGVENKPSVSRIIALSLVIPALTIPAAIVGITCCIRIMRREDTRASGSNQTSDRAGLSDTLTPGLGHISTIETYKRIPISESNWVEGPIDVTCTICLEDYDPEDTKRSMPECQHYFHVECIDKWLTIKAKCPICRTSQA